MRPLFGATALVLACSGCVEAPPPPVVITPVSSTIAGDDPNCREYTAVATIAGEQQQIVGRACRQADGSWRIVEGTPEQPGQVILIYPPPTDAYPYPPDYPWFWGPPFAVGTSFVFFAGHHHGGHHHGGHHRGHGHHGGSHGGHHG